MRILLLCHEHPPLGGGAGNAAAQTARQLAKFGDEVTFLSSRMPGLPQDESINGYRLHRLDIRRASASGCDIGELLRFARAGSAAAEDIVRQRMPDAVLAYFTIPEGYIARRLRRRFALPYVVSLRGGDVPGFLSRELGRYQWLARPFIKAIWNDAADIVTNSVYLARLAEKTTSRPITVIPNGYYTEDFTPGPPRRPSDPVRLVFVGRLVYQKGLGLLLDALASVRDRRFHLDVVGDGPLEPALRAKCAALGLNTLVSFKGWKKREELAELYRRSQVLVLPSLDEGLPNAVTEAMAAGLAIVASNAGGIPEAVTDGHNGYLFPAGDTAAIAAAIGKVLGSGDELDRLCRNSRERSRTWTWADAARSTSDILRSVIPARRQPR